MNELEFQCDRISHSFVARDVRLRAIDNITLSARVGEFVCIVGPSGCGKSTLLRVIAGLLTPTEGTVSFGDSREGTRHHSALVFQDHGVFPWMTVLDNVAFGLELQGMARHKREVRAREFIVRAGLDGFEKSFPHELSVGMRQRVGVARAFASDVQLLLMDEPFGSLDSQTKRVMQQDLLELWEEARRTVVYVTHDVEEAIALGDRVLVFSPRPACVIADFPLSASRSRDLHARGTTESRDLASRIWQLLENRSRPELVALA